MEELYLKKYLPLAPMMYGNTQQNRVSYLLYITCWIWGSVVTLTLVGVIIMLPAFAIRGMQSILAVDVTILICLLLNRKGYFRLAAIIFIMAFWLIATSLAYIEGGIASEAVVAYLPIIVAAGLLLGGGWGILMAALCVFTVLAMVLLEMHSMLPPKEIVCTPLAVWMGYSLSGMLTAAMQYLSARQLGFAYKRLKQEVAERIIAEDEQRKSELKYHTLVEHACDAIMVTDLKGNFIDVNHSTCEMFGYTKEDLLKSNIAMIIDPEHLKTNPIRLDLLVAGQTILRERRARHKNGAVIEVESNAKRFPDDTILVIARDITLRKRAEEEIVKERDLSDSVINSLPGVFFIQTLDGKYLRWNKNFESISGYSDNEIANLNALDFFDTGDRKLITETIAHVFKEGGTTTVEAEVITKSGKRKPYYFTGLIINYEGEPCVAGTGLDITEKVEARKVIKALNESLERKVAERTAELLDANKELEAFNYSVSHDLQSPLRVVSGFAKILLNSYADKIDDDGKHLLQSINNSVARMNQLIRDLLEFSKSGKAVMAKETVDMNHIVNGIINEVKMGREDFSTEIIVHHLETASSDVNLIKQVWANLIINAVKFSGKKERPVVEIGSRVNNNEVVYYIKDNGAGFDMQHSDKLFTAFQRMHPIMEFEGTGIGLATTHRIVTRHSGKIWAEAKLNEGATFYFTIPVE